MKYILELNARVSPEQSAELKHEHVIDALSLIDQPWGVNTSNIPFPGFGREHIASVNLSRHIGKGIKCSVFYRHRNMLDDDSLSDDRMYIEIDINKIDYFKLVQIILPAYINLFGAYRAELISEELMFNDFSRTRNINYRNTIVRFYPAGFFDDLLCMRVFKKNARGIFDSLNSKINGVKILNDGVYIYSESKILTIEEANDFNKNIVSILDIKTSNLLYS